MKWNWYTLSLKASVHQVCWAKLYWVLRSTHRNLKCIKNMKFVTFYSLLWSYFSTPYLLSMSLSWHKGCYKCWGSVLSIQESLYQIYWASFQYISGSIQTRAIIIEGDLPSIYKHLYIKLHKFLSHSFCYLCISPYRTDQLDFMCDQLHYSTNPLCATYLQSYINKSC